MAEVAGTPRGLYQTQMFRQQSAGMPMKGAGARACCARPSVFNTGGTREICGWELPPRHLNPEALPPSVPHQLHRLGRPVRQMWTGVALSPYPCMSVPVKQGLPTCLCCPPPQTNLGIQELESLGSILPCVSDLASLSLSFTIFK